MQQNQFTGFISEQDGYATLTFEIGTGQHVLNSQVEKTYTGGPYGTFLPCSKTERAGGVLLTYTLARKESLARILRQQDAYGPEMCSSMLLTTLEYLCHVLIACRGTDIYTDNISYQPDHIFWDAIEGRPYFVYFPLETGNQTGPAFLNLLYYLFGSMYTRDAMLSGYVQQYLAHGHFVPEEFLAASASWRASYAAQGGKKKKKQKAAPAAQPYQGYPPQGGYQGAPMQAAPGQPAPMVQQQAPPPPPPAPMQQQAPPPPPAPMPQYQPPAPQPAAAPYPQPPAETTRQVAAAPYPPQPPQPMQPGVQMAAQAAGPQPAQPQPGAQPAPPPFAPRPENERTVFNVENAAMAEFEEEAPTVFMGATSAAAPPRLLLTVCFGGQTQQHTLSVFPCVLGRSQRRANLILEDPEISNVHLEMSQSIDKNSFLAEDRGSKNGTLLNDAPLPAGQPHVVNAGDVVKLGQTTITIDIG